MVNQDAPAAQQELVPVADETKALTPAPAETSTEVINMTPVGPAFGDKSSFEHAQRVAKMLATSDMVPQSYKGNVQNIMIALELANRVGASILMVMQNLDIIHGKPSWSSKFIIGSINTTKRFSTLQYDVQGTGDEMTCMAFAFEKATGDKLEGVRITMKMAKDEGWLTKAGSKWKTMPDLMIRYRAAAFWGRLYVPEIMMGMYTTEEVEDMQANGAHTQDLKKIAANNAAAAFQQ